MCISLIHWCIPDIWSYFHLAFSHYVSWKMHEIKNKISCPEKKIIVAPRTISGVRKGYWRELLPHTRRVRFYTLAYPSLCNVSVYWKALLTVFSVLSSLFAVAAVSGVMYVCIHGAANLLQLNAETAAPYCIMFSCGKQVDCCWIVIVDSGWHRLYKLLTYAVLLRMNVCVNFTTTTSLF